MTHFKKLLLLLLCFTATTLLAKATTTVAIPDSIHAGFDALLQKHVSAEGVVNYKGFKADKAALEAYLKVLSNHVPGKDTPREQAMAFWINAYNAHTIDLIVRNYPVSSITKLDNGKTWEVKRIKMGNKKYSLNQIENEILRPQFQDARIHFALNCAARSCPPLYNHAFTGSNLDRELEVRAVAFINNEEYNSVMSKRLKISKIFEWYAADFGDLPKFLNRFSEKKASSKAVVMYMDYNWDLNE